MCRGSVVLTPKGSTTTVRSLGGSAPQRHPRWLLLQHPSFPSPLLCSLWLPVSSPYLGSPGTANAPMSGIARPRDLKPGIGTETRCASGIAEPVKRLRYGRSSVFLAVMYRLL